MNKTYGVCLGLLALGLVGLGAPASRAESRFSAGEAGGGSESATTSSTSAPASSSAADLRQRIDSLKAELADLNAELATKDGEPAAATADTPQDQGSPAPATPAQAPAAAAPAAAAPMPLSSPSMTAPLSTAVPHEISAGPIGKLEVTGILSGIALGEDNKISHFGPDMHFDVSNAQVFIQKTTGWWQFYLQGGAYNIPAVGYAFGATSPTSFVYGPLPVAYLKLVKGNFNVEVGELPTLVGAEYTFTFENMNIERGLLWNQEPAISRGIQLSDTYKKLSVSFAYTDGFFSNRYTSLSGSLAWAFNASNTLTFVGSGNAGAYACISCSATPLFQNNSEVYNLIYTYTHGNWVITPYYQYTVVKANPTIGIFSGSHTNGEALLANYNFKHGISLAIRPEYIKSNGGLTGNSNPSTNLLGYGPGSDAFSFTVTPTFAKDGFFIRGDFSIVHATNFATVTTGGSTPTTFGSAFGPNGLNATQARGVIEAGVMF